MPDEDVTPIRQQYLQIKREYPNAILFFRLGDFYETFDADAEAAAAALDIVLTSRNVAKGTRVPMAGIPYHAAENYIARLIERGFHVAICEQIGSSQVNGLFPRRVVRVVTPGTLVEPGLLPGDRSNYLAAMVIGPPAAAESTAQLMALAYADISTGEFAVAELPRDALRSELARLQPAEVIHADDAGPAELPESGELLSGPGIAKTTPWPAWRFRGPKCEEALLTHFRVASLDGFGLRDRVQAIRAAGALLQYVQETLPNSLDLLKTLRLYSTGEFMNLDSSTRRNLEIDKTLDGGREGSLLGVLDLTVTPMGRRLIQRWVGQPLLDATRIRRRQNGVQHYFEHGYERAEIRSALLPLADLERITNRIVAGLAQPRDLVAMRNSLEGIAKFTEGGKTEETTAIPHIELPQNELDLLRAAIAEEPPQTLQGTGIIRAGHSAELDSVIAASKHARDWIAGLESVERGKTGIKTLKVGYNKVFGYYIEISRGAASQAPDTYVRKQTLANAERFITPEMKEYETLVLNAEAHIREIELRVFREVCSALTQSAQSLLRLATALAELDVLAGLAEVAALGGYCRPQITEGIEIDIRDGRHPVVERTRQNQAYVPNDVVFGNGEIIRLITGPNMSGKSTYLRQTALIVIMAQIGSFVPARQAQLGLIDRIFARIGARDEIHAGQSTFMVEMTEAANILHNATPRSLLILDEIGRGTSTYDGISIAWAMVEHIHNHPQLRARTLFATHYHELTQLADLLPGVRNYNVAVTEADNQVVFLHRIIPGGADKSYGIHVAQLAGMPKSVIERARDIMGLLEKSSGRAVSVDDHEAQQIALFPETNPLLADLQDLDVDELSPIEALNKLFEWRQRFTK